MDVSLPRPRFAGSLALALLSLSASAAFAQVPPFTCGPDCAQPGRYVLCNDSFDTTLVSPGGVVINSFLDGACAQFTAPAATFQLTGFVGLFSGGDQIVSVLQVRGSATTPTPGPLIYELGVAVPSAAADGFSGLFFGPQALSADFRICVLQQIDDPGGNLSIRALRYDGDGFAAPNQVRLSPNPWRDAETSGPPIGDFILRAVVQYADLTPWSPGGSCTQVSDAGVAADAGPTDSGAIQDAGFVDSGPSPDAGFGLDATPSDAELPDADLADAEPSDSAQIDADAGPSAPPPPPTITAISPREGSNLTPVSLLVTGTGFVNGLSLRIGAISTSEIQVPGPTTITAQIPPSIAPGRYDVIVQNPDGQVAILSEGYTVLGQDAQSNLASNCTCTQRGGTSWAGLLLLGAPWLRRRRSEN